MIHCTLTQNKLRVEQDTDVLPFQYSNNINIQFIKDSTYENYVVTPYYAWVPTKSISPRKLDAFALPLKDGVFTLPMNAFVKDGYLGIAFSLTDGNEVLQTDPVYLAVQSSVGSNNILPENDSWQLVVIDTVNSYIELNVNDKLQALIKEVAKLDENSAELQREVNELIDKVNKMLEDGDFIPEHKWGNTFLHFKNPDGSWDNGVNLKGPSGVYFGNDTPPEDGEYNVWVLPDGTPDFEIYADQVKTQDGGNVQEKLTNSFSLGSDVEGKPFIQQNSGVIFMSNENADNLKTTGKYFVSGTEQSNTPSVNGWYIDVIAADDASGDYFTQVATVSSGYMTFRRTCVSGVFTDWVLIDGSWLMFETGGVVYIPGKVIGISNSAMRRVKTLRMDLGLVSNGQYIGSVDVPITDISNTVAGSGYSPYNGGLIELIMTQQGSQLYINTCRTRVISTGLTLDMCIKRIVGLG